MAGRPPRRGRPRVTGLGRHSDSSASAQAAEGRRGWAVHHLVEADHRRALAVRIAHRAGVAKPRGMCSAKPATAEPERWRRTMPFATRGRNGCSTRSSPPSRYTANRSITAPRRSSSVAPSSGVLHPHDARKARWCARDGDLDLPDAEPSVAACALGHERTRHQAGRERGTEGRDVIVDTHVAAPADARVRSRTSLVPSTLTTSDRRSPRRRRHDLAKDGVEYGPVATASNRSPTPAPRPPGARVLAWHPRSRPRRPPAQQPPHARRGPGRRRRVASSSPSSHRRPGARGARSAAPIGITHRPFGQLSVVSSPICSSACPIRSATATC